MGEGDGGRVDTGRPRGARLHADDVVERRADLTLHVDGRGGVKVVSAGSSTSLGLAALDIIRRLSRPTRVGELLDAVAGSAGAQAWMDASSTLVLLHRAGAVGQVGDADWDGRAESAAPFDSQFAHALMLHDVDRVTAYRAAIAEVVRPGDVVVDIGTGTGVLALAAVQAGARLVYAIEAGSVAEVAEAMVRGNGMSDRVQVLRGWSTEVELPERADVIVSETIGSEPLHERVLEIYRDARLRHARPGARFIPERLAVLGTGYQVPTTWKESFTPEAVAQWTAVYGTDFAPLLAWQGRQRSNRVIPAQEVQSWLPLTTPALLVSLDLTRVEDLRVDVQRLLPVTTAGRLDVLVTHFSAALSPGISLSTDPSLCRPSSWLHPARWVAPVDVSVGQSLTVRYRYLAGTPDALSLATVD